MVAVVTRRREADTLRQHQIAVTRRRAPLQRGRSAYRVS